MSLHTAAGQQHQPYTVEGLLMWEQWQWSSGWKIILIDLQYIDEDEWYEHLSESEDHHGWRVTHNAWHYDDNDGGGDDDHAASDVCDGDGDVCRGEDDFQKLQYSRYTYTNTFVRFCQSYTCTVTLLKKGSYLIAWSNVNIWISMVA